MASELRVNTLKDASGNNSVALSTVANGSAKAWINANDAKTTINDSLNISSLDDDGAGDFGLHFTTSFSTVNYSWAGGLNDGGTSAAMWQVDCTNGTNAASSIDFESYYVTASNNRTNNDNYCHLNFLGDLA
tara:strand:+ start:81 stop:476 length:396 start_codon:yes stop_codon:yes gene_type:complete